MSHEGGLLVRSAADEVEALLGEAHTRPCVMRGRLMEGWLRVEADGLGSRPALERWVRHGVAHAS